MNLIIFTDGGARGNPGPAAIGVVVEVKSHLLEVENKKTIAEISKYIGETTNNVAEYTAVIEATQWLRNNLTIQQINKLTTISFFLDSSLVVNQLNGRFKIKDSKLRELIIKVRGLEQEIGTPIYYSYVPREQNKRADFLVNKALDNLSK